MRSAECLLKELIAALPAKRDAGASSSFISLRGEAFLGNCLAALTFFVTFLGQAKKVKT
jgi:hypothetical protein